MMMRRVGFSTSRSSSRAWAATSSYFPKNGTFQDSIGLSVSFSTSTSDTSSRHSLFSIPTPKTSKVVDVKFSVHNKNDTYRRFKSTSTPISAAKPASPPTSEAAKAAAAALHHAPTHEEVEEEHDKHHGYIWDLGVRRLLPEWKKMFAAETLVTDVSAGLTVGCIAVPLSLAIAVASGVPAEVGLVTAAVSGVAGGLMGGTTLAITGPAAAISLLVLHAVQEHGVGALPLITFGCGALQLASGVTRMGSVAKMVPVSVIAGFTTGVGTLIMTNQLPKALDLVAPPGLNPIELLGFVAEHIGNISPSAAALAAGTSASMLLLPKLHPKMPSALLAVGGATVATHVLGLDVAVIGSIPSGLEAFQFTLPAMPPVEAFPSLAASTLLIYSMTSVESLLSCAALEKMKKTSYKHSPDQELVGQGLANVGSALFMGMPVTSVIARSGLNVRCKAETRLPALLQSGFVFGSVVFFSESIAMIPMPALSGVLITTGVGMLNPTEFQHCYKVQKSDVVPFLSTIGGMLSLGLAEGIGIGCVAAVALNSVQGMQKSKLIFSEASTSSMAGKQPEPARNAPSSWSNTLMKKMAFEETANVATTLTGTEDEAKCNPGNFLFLEDQRGKALIFDPSRNSVWKIEGPINFLSMFVIDELIENIMDRWSTKGEEIQLDSIVLDMHGVTNLEFTGMEELSTRLIEMAHGEVTLQMVNCSDKLIHVMDECDPKQLIERYGVLSPSRQGGGGN